jgi:hypothetical protein
MNKHDFVFDYEFKLFTFPRFEIDGTSDGEGCDLFLYDTKQNLTYNIQYMNNIIKFCVDMKNNNSEHYHFTELSKFDFCENFEEICFKIYNENKID